MTSSATTSDSLLICDEMIADLNREIRSARAAMEAQALPVMEAVPVAREGPYLIVRIQLSGAVPRFRSEQVLLLRCGQRDYPIQVCSARGRVLTVASVVELPAPIPVDTVIINDDVWLLERLKATLRHVRIGLEQEQPRQFNGPLAELVLGCGDFHDNSQTPGEVPPEEALYGLNERQQRAVEASLAQKVSYLWGPPGTGKTRTAAAIVHAHVTLGRRVLVVTPSNAAADVATAAIAQRLSEHPRFDSGMLLRIGPQPTRQLREQLGDRVVPQDVARRLIQEASLDVCNVQECAHPPAQGREAAKLHELLEACQVVVTPVHNTYLSRQLRGRFDLVLVDEASMVSVPQIYLAVGMFARRSVVVAGDFAQLASPVAHARSHEVPWLATDVFSRVGIPEDFERDDEPPYVVMLTEQYRMAPPIAELVSALFYMGRLSTSVATRRRPWPAWPPSNGSVVLVDTSTLGPTARVPSGTTSRTNEVHASIVSRLVASLTDADGGSHPGSVLVMSPFSSQVEVLRGALRRTERRAQITVSSVHRAQGSEADTVVLSLDDAPGAPLSRFMAARDWSSDGARLMNVGLSRARGRVILVAALEHLERAGGPVVRRLLRLLQEEGQVLGPDEF